jgi:ABC-type branched-subunit amino acid transport system substrate-binding protein
MSGWTRRSLIGVMLVAMVVSACGRSSKSSTATPGGTTATTVAQSAAGDFGTLKGLCGAGDAKGATAQGVTDTELTVGTMSDPGNTIVPGLNQELFDAADAFVGWCNDAGGILGRKIKLVKHDSALLQVGPRMTEACASDFALVGNGEALDANGVPIRTGCKLPEISAYDVSAAAGTAALSLQAIPTPNNQSRLGGPYKAFAAFDKDATQHYGLLSSTQQSIKDSGDRNRAAAEQLGFKVVDYEELPLAVDNWRPIAENVKNKGVQILSVQGNPTNIVSLLKAMTDVGYFPKYFILDANHYDSKLINEGGALLDKTTILVNSPNPPFEQPEKYPAIKQYLDNLAKYAGGKKPASLGVNATSAWVLFAQAAKACGSNLTRECLLQNAAVKDWTAGGLHSPVNPGNAASGGPQCFTLHQATPSGFKPNTDITKPNKDGIFNCDPANAFNLPGFPKSS